jgi:hypothetical protein
MNIRIRVICKWCRWNYKKLTSWTNFTACSCWRKYFITIVCRVCNVYAEKWVQFYGLFMWTRFLLILLVKTATDFESQFHVEKAWYRASNSSSWGAAVEGAVCRGWVWGDIRYHIQGDLWPSLFLLAFQKRGESQVTPLLYCRSVVGSRLQDFAAFWDTWCPKIRPARVSSGTVFAWISSRNHLQPLFPVLCTFHRTRPRLPPYERKSNPFISTTEVQASTATFLWSQRSRRVLGG